MIIIKDFFKLFLFVNILFIPLAYFDLQNSVDSLYKHQKNETYGIIVGSQKRIAEYLNDSDLVGACSQLNAEKTSNVIDLYYLETKNGICRFPKTLIAAPDIPMNTDKAHEFNLYQNTIAMTGLQVAPNKLVIGKFIAPKKSITDYLFNYSIIFNAAVSEFIRSFLITVIIVITLLAVFSQQIKKIFNTDKKNLWLKILINAFEKLQLGELNLVKKITSTLNQENIKLITYNEFIENSLEQSLLKEIQDNQKSLPLIFEGTVARVDINGFSTVVAEQTDQISFMLTDAMEKIGCELILRYSGLFEKTVGDEMIVIFRGNNSRLFAIAFIRDLMEEFSKIVFKTDNYNQTFLMKGTLSTSQINFRKRRSGYGFDGFALTLTARLLSTIQRKDTNIVSALSSDIPYIQPLILKYSNEEVFNFKNMASDRGVFIDEFKKIQDYSINEQNTLLTYFRSDNDIEVLLSSLTLEISFELKKTYLSHLRSFLTGSINEQVSIQWLRSIQVLSENLINDDELWIFTNLISIGKNLIPIKNWNSNISQQLLTYLNRKYSSRIISTIIELLSQKDPTFLSNCLESTHLEFDKTNRIQGDLLIAECISKLNAHSLRKILEMMNSTNELRADTGIYVSTVVLISCSKQNKALLNTFNEYHQIVEKLESVRSKKLLSERLNLFIETAFQEIRS